MKNGSEVLEPLQSAGVSHTKIKSMETPEGEQKPVRPEPTASWITVTQIMAKEWLTKNMPTNRNLNPGNFIALRTDMNKGDFVQTGETIKFDWDGNLIDGQHRLQAIVDTGKPQKLLIVRGLDPESFMHIDTGRTRNAADVLAIEGVSSPSKVAAMVKFIINYRRGRFLSAAIQTTHKQFRITNQDVAEFVRKNQESIEDSFAYGNGKNNKDKILTGAHMSGLHYILKTITAGAGVEADDFFHKVGMGADLDRSSAIYLLRTRLISDLRAKRKMPPLEKIALVIKAWNFYRTKKNPKVLTWSSVQEPFPKPV